jgi:hypothetical protein
VVVKLLWGKPMVTLRRVELAVKHHSVAAVEALVPE